MRNRDTFEMDDGRPPAKKPRVVGNPIRRFDDVRVKVSEKLRNGKIVIVDDNDNNDLLKDVDAYELNKYNTIKVGNITFSDYAEGANMHVFPKVTCIVYNIADKEIKDPAFADRMCTLLPDNGTFILGVFDNEPNPGEARKMEQHMEIYGGAYRRIFQDIQLCQDPSKTRKYLSWKMLELISYAS
jgi:hypothetical protein